MKRPSEATWRARAWRATWLTLGAIGLALGASACSPNAIECAPGRYCPADCVCVKSVSCCASPEWLKTLPPGTTITPSPNGMVVTGLDGGSGLDDGGAPGGVDDGGVPLSPMCGP